jgi:PAS domain S-box-containing protein
MSVGDSRSIEKQLGDIEDELENTEIVICDFDQRIIFSTHESHIGQQVPVFTDNKQTLTALKTILEEADHSHRINHFEEEADGKNYLVTINSIINDDECHHCHGSTRRVLGGIIVRQSTDATYAAIATLRNWTIIISIIGIGALLSLIYFLLARMVTQPVNELAAKAEELAKGDLSVSVPVTSEDSIGVLSKSFNSMVRSINDQIEYANSLKYAIADPLVFVDSDLVVTFINEACAQITGYSKEETEGRLTCRQIFKSDICKKDICDSTCPLKHSLALGESVANVRTTIFDKSGRSIPIITSANALKDAHGAVIGAVEIFRDISDLLEAERLRYIQETADREEEQRKYLESRAENLLETLSEASEGNLKVRAEFSQDKGLMNKIAKHTNEMLDNLEKMYARISTFSKELELEVARRTMMLRSRTLLLERANRELQELDRLKSSFLANMSHELRTPMNSILGYTELILDRVDGEINEEQEKSLLKVENNAQHLLQLINDILDMSKIEAGKIELYLETVDIKELLDSLGTFFRPATLSKNIYLNFDFAEDLPSVYIDEDKVRQIFNNLLSNAIKFTPQGGITIHIKPSTRGIRSGEEPLFLEICVEDTGIGIKKEDISKLFNKFNQIDVSSTRQYEGTGLGLSIARGLVVLHKGNIWAESEYGKGSRLYFTLPTQEKVLEKSDETTIDQRIAKAMADYFDKPVDLFLKEPSYIGKPVQCWKYLHCGQSSCPAYGNKESRCWLISGTHSKGIEVVKYPKKAEFCKGCEIIENLLFEGDAPQEIEIEVAEKDNDSAGTTRKKTILAIDDNPEVIELIRKNIGSDYEVVGQLSGEGAVEMAKKIMPAAITLDIMMPKKDGWQVLQDLKKDPETEDIPVIILSIVDEKKTGINLGAAEYLVKPVNKNVLLHNLKKLEKLTQIKNILIVDNESDTVDALGGILREIGYRITVASTKKEAIEEITTSMPDLIVLNPIMPDADGVGLIEYIKREKEIKNIPIILITHKDLNEEYIEKLDGQIQAILNKGTLSAKELLEELKNTIKRIS